MNKKTNLAVANVAVIGGGIAAFAACRALRGAGFPVLAFRGRELPVAPERLLVCPRLQRGESLHARFLRESYREACAFYEQSPYNKAIVARGALRLAQNAQEQVRLRALAQELPHLCRWLSAEKAQRKSGLSKNATRWGGIFLPHALVLAPRELFGQSFANNETTPARVSVARMVQEEDGGWRIFPLKKEAAKKEADEEAEKEGVRAEAVVLALGAQLPTFLRESVFPYSLPYSSSNSSSSSSPSFSPPSSCVWHKMLDNLLAGLQTGSGRLDICNEAALSFPPRLPVCASGWIMPFPRARIAVVRGLAPSRVEQGAEENRKRLVEWCGLPEDHRGNKARFEKPYQASRLSTRDRLPLLGEIPCNGRERASRLFLFSALGGHGFLTAPLCAKNLVRLLQGRGAERGETALLSPQRFLP